MVNANSIYQNVIEILDKNEVDYKLFEHKAAFTYEELAAAQKEAGFFGTEAKCLVIKAGDRFVVYVTLQGNRTNFDNVKNFLAV